MYKCISILILLKHNLNFKLFIGNLSQNNEVSRTLLPLTIGQKTPLLYKVTYTFCPNS